MRERCIRLREWIKKLSVSIIPIFSAGLKLLSRIATRIFLAAFLVIPFLHNIIDHTLAQWLWYPCCLFEIIQSFWDFLPNRPVKFKTPIFDFLGKWGFFALIITFSSAFVFNYYTINYIWCWVIALSIAVYAPIFFFALLKFEFIQNQRNEEDIKIATINIAKYILLCWVCDLFYVSVFNEWLIPKYLFGIITIVIGFCNLSKAFLSSYKELQFLLPFDFLVNVAVSVYLIYSIPDGSLQNIVLTIVAAIYGGVLTLVGVAWTIKKGDADRQSEILRLEDERTENERKRHVPFIKISNEPANSTIVNAYIMNGLKFDDPNDLSLLENNVFYLITIKDFVIKNISASNIIFKGVCIHNKYFPFSRAAIAEPNSLCLIKTTNNYSISVPSIANVLELITSDILGNWYSTECFIQLHTDSGRHMECTNKHGDTLIGFYYTYVIESTGLPTRITDRSFLKEPY